jgi:hypothetical protein
LIPDILSSLAISPSQPILLLLYFLSFSVGWDWVHDTSATVWPIVPASNDRWGWLWSICWNENWQGKPKCSEKTFLSAILSTTNPTWHHPDSNTGRPGGKPVTIILLLLVGWDFWYCGHYWPIVSAPDDRWWWLWRNWWNKDWQGKPKYSKKTFPSATLSTTNPTWHHPDLNTGRRGGKPVTNRLSYGTAFMLVKTVMCVCVCVQACIRRGYCFYKGKNNVYRRFSCRPTACILSYFRVSLQFDGGQMLVIWGTNRKVELLIREVGSINRSLNF